MRESNFSNPAQNKACVCISAAIYDRRAIDCTATLPLINSLNHLAYLTSTSPRIREMVCVDGGLERLIRILGQVPRSPSPPPVRGVITAEMQAVWQWSLAFQCVVNIGVRGSENVRTRVVEAGMVPVSVRVLESYLRVADALREERKREARREDARQRMERAAESTATSMLDAVTPTVANTQRLPHGREAADNVTAVEVVSASSLPGSRNGAEAPVLSVLSDTAEATDSQPASLAPIIASLAPVTLDGTVSPSSSASSLVAGDISRPGSSNRHLQPQGSSLANASSVEDLTASGSGSDGADDTRTQRDHPATHDGDDSADNRTTPRPPRRTLVPMGNPTLQPTPVRSDILQERSLAAAQNARREQARLRHEMTTQARTTDRRQLDRHEQHTNRDRRVNINDMIYREEEVLLSLQLLAYLSKYAHVRTLFHRDLATLNALDPLDTLELAGSGPYQHANQSWSPSDPPKKNVFCIAERYTLRSSRTGLSHFATLVESRIAPEIQYWAGVIMRNACRKDEKHGGIRQCANMLCGKWEEQPREFAKCRRCRKAKYCSKQCQSKGWQMGHRFWCSARSDEEQAEARKDAVKEQENAAETRTVIGTDANNDLAMQEQLGQVQNQMQDRERTVVHPLAVDNYSDTDQISTATPAETRAASPATLGDATSYANADLSMVLDTTEPRRPIGASYSHPFGDGRRMPSAIPQHLQAPSASRSRTTSATSSSADVSDMSDDEMERAHRRTLQDQGTSQSSLSHVVSADRSNDVAAQRVESSVRNRPMRQRTDLAGRPLPPPVIAQHDGTTSLNMSSDGDVMGADDHIGAAADNEAEAAVFGRGDFDQMLWRGQTPSREEEEVTRRLGRGPARDGAGTPSSRPGSALARSADEGSASEADESTASAGTSFGLSRSRHGPTPSLLNTALLLAGDEDVRRPNSSGLLSPRQQHRYASLGVSSSMSSGLADLAAMSPTSPTRSSHHPSLADTLVDWNMATSSLSSAVPSTPTTATAQAHRSSMSNGSASAQTPRQRPADVDAMHVLSAIEALPADVMTSASSNYGPTPLAQAMMSPGAGAHQSHGAAGDLRSLFTASTTSMQHEDDVDMGM